MTILPERTALLILEGGRITGTMTEGYWYAEERLYIHEAKEVFEFCKWIDKEVGGCSEYNIYWLFQAWKNPNDKILQGMLEELKKRIQEINQLTKK